MELLNTRLLLAHAHMRILTVVSICGTFVFLPYVLVGLHKVLLVHAQMQTGRIVPGLGASAAQMAVVFF